MTTNQIGATMTDRIEAPSKADYVRSQPQTREHHCHWPSCGKSVPPAMWGCRQHWFALPQYLRDKIWATYRPGQEIDGTPSAAYLAAAAEVQAWIRAEIDLTDQL
jgi:hypothetical protein